MGTHSYTVLTHPMTTGIDDLFRLPAAVNGLSGGTGR